jgi:hypothetical protein
MNQAINVLEEFYKKELDIIPVNCDAYPEGFLSGIEKSIYILKEHKKKQEEQTQVVNSVCVLYNKLVKDFSKKRIRDSVIIQNNKSMWKAQKEADDAYDGFC